MKDADVGFTELVNQSLRNNGLKAATEGLIIAAQDQRLATRFYIHTYIHKLYLSSDFSVASISDPN